MSQQLRSHTVTLEEDPDTGEVILPFPEELISELGWTEGTEVEWIDNKDGTYTLVKKEKDVIPS